MQELLSVLDTLQKIGTLGLVLLVLYGGARPAERVWWLDVFPGLTTNGIPDTRLSHTHELGKCTLRFSGLKALADFTNLVVGQASIYVSLALGHGANPPTLLNHIGGIVFRRSEKQVLGVHTARSIAVVAAEHASRDWAVVQFPRYAMCPARLPFPVGFDHQVAVTLWRTCTTPQPTGIGLFNIRPKARTEIRSGCRIGMHQNFLSGVVPSVVVATRGLLSWNYTSLTCCHD